MDLKYAKENERKGKKMEYLGFLIAIIVLFVILKILALPLKIIIKLMLNALIGGVVLFLLNMIGARFGLIIDINWISTLLVGFFGVPGVILVLIFQFLL